MALILAIETSCDETAVALLSEDAILSERVYSQTEHALHGGVVPEIAARDHQARLPGMVREVLLDALVKVSDLDEIAYTHGPGLAGCLLVGHYYAHGLASAYGIPLRGIHHLEGHIMSALTASFGTWGERYKRLMPSIVLVVSGGHTMLVDVCEGSYRVIGETLDDAVGEVYDKIARIVGFPYPGARALSQVASTGEARYKLPMPMLNKNGGMMSFSGLKTAARLLWEHLNRDGKPSDTIVADFAASFEKTLMDTLMHKIRWAMEHSGYTRLVMVGGVSANRYLRMAIDAYTKASGIEGIYPPLAYCTDNAAMIGISAHVRRSLGVELDHAAIRLRPTLLAPVS
jgi:N6-L-threonylcarbamoyladenine synthase